MAYPNFKSKYKESPLITADSYLNYLRKQGKFPKFKSPEGVILAYSRRLMNYVVEKYKPKKVEAFSGDFYLLKGKLSKVGVIGNFGIGAPLAGVIVEELVSAGVKEFISIGEAGSLQKDLKVGSIIVCDKAIRDEGVSHHYLKPSKYSYASSSMVREIENVLSKLQVKYKKGASWTIDTPYRETLAEVRKYQREGVLCVEMEAAAIFAVASCRKAEAGAIFTVSDYLADLEWSPQFHQTTPYLAQLFEVTKEVLMR